MKPRGELHSLYSFKGSLLMETKLALAIILCNAWLLEAPHLGERELMMRIEEDENCA